MTISYRPPHHCTKCGNHIDNCECYEGVKVAKELDEGRLREIFDKVPVGPENQEWWLDRYG